MILIAPALSLLSQQAGSQVSIVRCECSLLRSLILTIGGIAVGILRD